MVGNKRYFIFFVLFHLLLSLTFFIPSVFTGCSKKVLNVNYAPQTTAKFIASDSMFSWQEEPKYNSEYPVIRTIFFGFDSAEIRGCYEYDLKALCDHCKENQSVIIAIEGFADVRGSNQYNHNLGLRRCLSIKNFLQSAGVKNTIDYVSYGEGRPVVENCADERCHQKNRRVEISFR